MIKNIIRVASLLALLITASTASAQGFDVDEADTLDFEAFHKEPEKIAPTSNKQAINTRTQLASTQPANGNRFEIKERYALNRSSQTPYSAFYVIESMHKKMAELCPNGWNKIQEWSVPVENDYFLHYEIECR